VNIPLREPLYPEKEIQYEKNVKIIQQSSSAPVLWSDEWDILSKEFESTSNVLIICGQQEYNKNLSSVLSLLSERNNIPVIADHISNIRGPEIIHHHDIILSRDKGNDNLIPDMIITVGKSLISKNLKLFLRKQKSKHHWHVQPSGKAADTFQSLSRVIHANPEYFFIHLLDNNWKKEEKFFLEWKQKENHTKEKLEKFFKSENIFTEFRAIKKIIESIPKNSVLHLANSMPVRYVNYLTALLPEDVHVFANRGTSGIDGVISTAYGAALSTDKIVTVITGDMAFLYDRNAWWNNYTPKNLRIVILNNHGGGIFRILDGPNRQPELEEYFETKQLFSAENTAKEFNLQYQHCKSEDDLIKELKMFFKKFNIPKILEIETDSKTNAEYFKNFKIQVCS
jgi:2-succinyl-5-enolpyruvyl-6-hydroxy-3-cyclohexene-1-carboxylate synthase